MCAGKMHASYGRKAVQPRSHIVRAIGGVVMHVALRHDEPVREGETLEPTLLIHLKFVSKSVL
jgi:hypothetical protein